MEARTTAIGKFGARRIGGKIPMCLIHILSIKSIARASKSKSSREG